MVSFLAKHQVRWQTRVRWPPLVRWLRRVRKLRRVRWQPRPIIAPKPEEREQNITYMDASLYKAAAEGKIEVFNNYQELDLESQKTPNHDNVLHVNLATHELAAWFSNGILSRTRSFPKLYFFILLFLWFFIIKKKSEKRSDFIRQILTKCPSLLLQTNAKGQTPLHVAAMNGHSAIVKLLIKSCAKARDGDLEKLEMGQVNAVREMLRITDQESNTALHLAVKYGDVEMVKELLEHEDPDFQYSANKNQETPLYLAAKRGDTGMLSILLEISNSTGHGCPHSRTALHAAAMAGDIAGMLMS
uniref:Uncharacterized protein n=1 Tax=Gossypium raimondii TaxID=29730 RepID=A0A0D2TRH4_GOSRA|nr:hypothetical protein B456_012G180000 [Gossypium raimondii]